MSEKIPKEDQFIDRLKKIYPDRYEKILEFKASDRPKSFRVNHFKAHEDSVIKSLKGQGFDILESEVQGGFICLNDSEDHRVSETVESKSMQIYIQELSSMIPALVLDLRRGDKILDLCAAPGSKTTQIADLLQNDAEIIANEQSRDRWFKLKQILREYGSTAKTTNENGKILQYKFQDYVQYFDRILLDAPCSNESSLRIDQPQSFKFWRSSNSSGLAKLQKGLLAAAISMLKPGGTLVYSTCTFAVEENEGVVDWALSKFPEIKLTDCKDDPSLSKLDNLDNGLTEYKNKQFDPSLSKTLRVLPNEYFKGFYIAKLCSIGNL
jgi:NOL1/NOP2/sun family putative RNA methylase